MALESQIEAADRAGREPSSPITPTFTSYSNPLLSLAQGDAEAEAANRSRAIRYVRREGGEHADEFLDALGLTEVD
jgi:hypothetical protein